MKQLIKTKSSIRNILFAVGFLILIAIGTDRIGLITYILIMMVIRLNDIYSQLERLNKGDRI